MLLEKERERLLAVLDSRTSSHAERTRARRALEDDLSESDEAGTEREASTPKNGDAAREERRMSLTRAAAR